MIRFTLQKRAMWTTLAMVAYYAIMEIYYFKFIIMYSRFGFYLDLNWNKYWETKLIFSVILVYTLLVSRRSEFIFSIIIFFLFFFLVPSLTIYSFSDRFAAPMYSITALILLLGLTSYVKIRIPELKSWVFTEGLIFIMLVLLFVPILFQFGFYFNLSNLVLEDVYETREAHAEQTSFLLNYLYSWLSKSIVPLLLIFFLIRKKYFFAFVATVILVYLYFISGNKLVYMTAFVMLFFFFFGKGYTSKTMYFSFAMVLAISALPLIDEFVLNSSITLKGTFIMRMLFFPSQLNYFYFDLFKGDPLFFAESKFFSSFFDYPYHKPVGFIISDIYFDAPEMNANNGIISDGYMNMGYAGIGLNIAIVSALFLFFNSLNLDARYLGIFFIMVFLFLSAPMLSMFITSGLVFVVLMALTLLRQNVS